MIVFYDEECILCRRFKQGLSLLDKDNSIEFVSIHDSESMDKYPELNKEECEDEVHMLKEGKIFRGSQVIEELIKVLPGVKKFAWLVERESSKSALNVFYGQLNEMRAMQRKKCFRCGTNKQKDRVRRYQEGEI